MTTRQSAVIDRLIDSARSASAPRRLAPSPFVWDYHRPFGVPRDGGECEGLLAVAESRLKNQPHLSGDVLADLARFVGASSRVWTDARRSRLHQILARAGDASIGPLFSAVRSCPRVEVIEETAEVLGDICADDAGITVAVAEGLAAATRDVSPPFEEPSVREVALRSLVRAFRGDTSDSVLRAFVQVLSGDRSAQVRDAAAQAIAACGAAELAPVLRDLRNKETDSLVRDSIDEALAEFGAP